MTGSGFFVLPPNSFRQHFPRNDQNAFFSLVNVMLVLVVSALVSSGIILVVLEKKHGDVFSRFPLCVPEMLDGRSAR